MNVQDLVSNAEDATELLSDYATGRSDPVTIAESHLERIEQLNPILNAFTTRASDVLDRAVESRDRWKSGTPLGVLDGVPLVLKDNLVCAGLPAAWGNAVLTNRVPEQDEIPVAALRKAGAIVLGMANTPEFAVEGYTGNATFGVTRNPYDPTLTPGGSSGGVVAAVASGMAAVGLGTDGGGSIRRPAAYTGLWGLKPGIGNVRRGGGLMQVLLDFETVGPLTRSARDLCLLHQVLAKQPMRPHPRPLDILAVAQIQDAPCDPGIRDVFESTIERLSSMGHRVVQGTLPVDLGPMNEVWSQIAEVGLAHMQSKDPTVMAAAAEKYQEMANRGALISAASFHEVLSRVFALREAARGLWGYDAIVTPAAAAPPWSAEQAYPETIDGKAVGPRGHAVYTGWVNAAGLPGLACPAGLSEGLPVGVQFIADHAGEGLLLSLATTLDIAD
ncbi:amidase [Granulosicoccus sp. 3-233]|uniref:amidase n=1 Tax=Granulosicoccus sp. 3-233 TaxID=3417969 RepID=UPI003D33EFB9